MERISRFRDKLPIAPLLYTREQVAALLGGVSVATVRRMERDGLLKPIRLTGRNSGQVFFKAADVQSLVDGASERNTKGA